MTNSKPSEICHPASHVDLTRLMGFAAVETAEVDFRDETFAAKTGAKVGEGEPGSPHS